MDLGQFAITLEDHTSVCVLLAQLEIRTLKDVSQFQNVKQMVTVQSPLLVQGSTEITSVDKFARESSVAPMRNVLSRIINHFASVVKVTRVIQRISCKVVSQHQRHARVMRNVPRIRTVMDILANYLVKGMGTVDQVRFVIETNALVRARYRDPVGLMLTVLQCSTTSNARVHLDLLEMRRWNVSEV